MKKIKIALIISFMLVNSDIFSQDKEIIFNVSELIEIISQDNGVNNIELRQLIVRLQNAPGTGTNVVKNKNLIAKLKESKPEEASLSDAELTKIYKQLSAESKKSTSLKLAEALENINSVQNKNSKIKIIDGLTTYQKLKTHINSINLYKIVSDRSHNSSPSNKKEALNYLSKKLNPKSETSINFSMKDDKAQKNNGGYKADVGIDYKYNTYPSLLSFDISTNLTNLDNKEFDQDVSSLGLTFDHYLKPAIETYFFYREDTNSFMEIDKRRTVGIGLEWEQNKRASFENPYEPGFLGSFFRWNGKIEKEGGTFDTLVGEKKKDFKEKCEVAYGEKFCTETEEKINKGIRDADFSPNELEKVTNDLVRYYERYSHEHAKWRIGLSGVLLYEMEQANKIKTRVFDTDLDGNQLIDGDGNLLFVSNPDPLIDDALLLEYTPRETSEVRFSARADLAYKFNEQVQMGVKYFYQPNLDKNEITNKYDDRKTKWVAELNYKPTPAATISLLYQRSKDSLPPQIAPEDLASFGLTAGQMLEFPGAPDSHSSLKTVFTYAIK